jgi:hypothetical protein
MILSGHDSVISGCGFAVLCHLRLIPRIRVRLCSSVVAVRSRGSREVHSGSASLMMTPRFNVKLCRVLNASRTESCTRNNRSSVVQSVTTYIA